MPIRNLLRLMPLCLFGSLLVVPPAHVAAQDPVSELDPLTRAQFAAVALTADDLPDGYVLEGETLLNANQIAPGGESGITAETLTAGGFAAAYASVYAHESGDGRISSYVSLWDDADASEAAFALLEDEAVVAPDGDVTDSKLDAGNGPSELTTGTISSEGTPMQVSDATFVVGSLMVGVSSEGSAEAVIDNAGMTSLAEALEARALSVSDGEAPEGIDFTLAVSTLNLAPLGTEVQVGFLSSSEAETLYGLSGSSLGNLQTSWVSFVALGDEATAPFVVAGKSSFADANTAGRVVEQAAQLVPLSVSLQPVADYAVQGVTQVRGFSYVSPATPGSTEANSFRAVAQLENEVVIIDVQGAASVDEARATVDNLLAVQLNCTDDGCDSLELTLGS